MIKSRGVPNPWCKLHFSHALGNSGWGYTLYNILYPPSDIYDQTIIDPSQVVMASWASFVAFVALAFTPVRTNDAALRRLRQANSWDGQWRIFLANPDGFFSELQQS